MLSVGWWVNVKSLWWFNSWRQGSTKKPLIYSVNPSGLPGKWKKCMWCWGPSVSLWLHDWASAVKVINLAEVYEGQSYGFCLNCTAAVSLKDQLFVLQRQTWGCQNWSFYIQVLNSPPGQYAEFLETTVPVFSRNHHFRISYKLSPSTKKTWTFKVCFFSFAQWLMLLTNRSLAC